MVQLTERFDFDFSESTLSEGDGLLQSVCLCGNVSKNGRTYPPESFGDGSVYNGRPVFLNHNVRDVQDRDVRDMAGTIESVAVRNGKPFGSIRFTELNAGSDLRKVAKSKLKNVGMSHVAKCKTNEERTVVEEVQEVVSVDLVCFPATTKNLSERVKDMSENTAAADLLQKQIAAIQSEKDVAVKERDEAKAALDSALERNASLEESNTTLQESNETLTAEVDAFRAEKALIERRSDIASELKEADLDHEDKALVSETFVNQLMSEPDSEKRKAVIADRKAVRESAGNNTTVTQQRQSSGKPDFDSEQAMKDCFVH